MKVKLDRIGHNMAGVTQANALGKTQSVHNNDLGDHDVLVDDLVRDLDEHTQDVLHARLHH